MHHKHDTLLLFPKPQHDVLHFCHCCWLKQVSPKVYLVALFPRLFKTTNRKPGKLSFPHF